MPGETDAYRYEANGENLRAENSHEIAESNSVSKTAGKNVKKIIMIGSILFLGMFVGLVVCFVMLSHIQSQAMNEIKEIKSVNEKSFRNLTFIHLAIQTGIDGIKTDNEKKFRNFNSSVQDLEAEMKEGQKDNERKFQYLNTSTQNLNTEMKEGQKDNERKFQYLNSSTQNLNTEMKEGQEDNERKFQYLNSSTQSLNTEMKEGQRDNERKFQYLNSSAQNFKTNIMRNILGNAANKESICYMGLKSRAVPNSAFSASSAWDNEHQPYFGRLDSQPGTGNFGAWSTKRSRVGEWIQIDLGSLMDIAGIVTQGHAQVNQFVTSYKVSCGISKNNMEFVTENGITKVFRANVERNAKIYNKMPRIITCRYVVIYPQTYHVHMAMRIEFVDGKCFDFFQL